MIKADFFSVKGKLEKQFEAPEWIEESGIELSELREKAQAITFSDLPKITAKAKTLELILSEGRIAVDKNDIFQDKLNCGRIMSEQKRTWHNAVMKREFSESNEYWKAAESSGAGFAQADYGHLTPNTAALCELGFVGVLERALKEKNSKKDISEKQLLYYDALVITWKAIIAFTARLAEAIRPYNSANAECLDSLTVRAPQNTYEAMQIIWLYFAIHELWCGERVRTLGRMDVLLYPFYKKDIESGRYSKDEIREMMRYFLFKMWAAKIPFDLPFAISGESCDGESDVTNEITYMIVEVFDELCIHSPKIHVRICDKTPETLIKRVLECIRKGNSGFLLMNDRIAVESLVRVGIEKKDARNYVPVGCYENAAWGVEMPCTGNSALSLPKALEYTVCGGKDFTTGVQMSVETPQCKTYEDVCNTVKIHINDMCRRRMEKVNLTERFYSETNPDSIMSGLCDYSVMCGTDVFEGGAKYNNSSVNYMGLATLADSLAAIKTLVFEKKAVELDELFDILKNNWEGREDLRFAAKNLKEKYGNNNAVADEIAKDLTDYIASITNNKPNGRGGVYKAGCFSIDLCFRYGKKIMATPDGRLYGEQFAKNMCAVNGMDKNGITSLLISVAKTDHADFANGTVLDFVLHPSAVCGDEGLCAMRALVKTYFDLGGLAMHGNVFDSKLLCAAQKEPDKYANLQVRVCGWNVFFVNLSKEEQDSFIVQSMNLESAS